MIVALIIEPTKDAVQKVKEKLEEETKEWEAYQQKKKEWEAYQKHMRTHGGITAEQLLGWDARIKLMAKLIGAEHRRRTSAPTTVCRRQSSD